jgi:hypothetical protein
VKTIVSLQELLEYEIKPNALLEQYFGLVRESIPAFFPRESLQVAHCPPPGSGVGREVFEKWGFTYCECEESGSLFVSPRPDEASLIRYHRSSPAARYWQDKVLPSTESARVEQITAPRAEWVADGVI